MVPAAEANGLFGVAGCKLRSVVGGYPGAGLGEFSLGPLQDRFDLSIFHRLTDLMVNDEAAAALLARKSMQTSGDQCLATMGCLRKPRAKAENSPFPFAGA